LPSGEGFDWSNLGLRIVSGTILGALAGFTVLAFGWPYALAKAPFLMLVSMSAALLCHEWALMVARPAPRRMATLLTIAVIAVCLLAYIGRYALAWGAVALGAAIVAQAARLTKVSAVDGALGVVYFAPAGMVLVWLITGPQGPGWVTLLFASAWSADIFAFLVGSALKGPKLWPRFSPKKTWSGFLGGLAAATLASVIVAALLMHLSLVGAAAIGFCAGLATMAGDLWESMLKRRYGVKDAGDLIPGHGGLLDRVDGLIFAVMAVAVARLVVKIGWAH
jgi:phosphatidate cytidylyltransferase